MRGRARRATLAGRLIVGSAVVLVVVMAVLGVVLDRMLERVFLDDLTDSLAAEARAVRRALPDDPAALPQAVVALGGELRARVTVVRSDGGVLADSLYDPATAANPAGRPEIRAALRGGVGVATRNDETTGEPFRFVALPAENGRIVRVAAPTARVRSRLGHVRGVVAGGAVIGTLAALAVLALGARRLTRPLGEMTGAAAAVAGGDLARRVPVEGTSDVATLAETINRMADELGARIEDATRDRRTRDLILGAMGEGVLLLDAAGTVQYGNAAAAVILGRSPRPGEPARGVLPAALGRLVGEARAEGGPRVEEIVMGPSPRTVEASGVPLGGGPILVVLRDVTEARRVEALRRDFVADASHELKTPAAAILASAETLRASLGDDPDAARGFADRLERDARRLSRLVTDLLDLSRLEAERPELEPIRLDDVAREEIERTRPEAAAAGVSVGLDTADVVTVRGSRKDLALLLRNLLDNAIRYTTPGGHAEVSVVRGDGRAVLSVRDDGMGIATRDLPRVFERFYRVDKARSRGTGGTGLGLAIVKHVAERHGGRVEAESELGRGSTFRVILPAAE